MDILDLDGIIEEAEAPVCPMCGQTIHISEAFSIARSNDLLFLVHYACGDMEFFNA